MRRVQLYLTEEQYRLLKRRAGESGSIAAVVRDLIDASTDPGDAERDPFYRHLLAEKPEGRGERYTAEEAKRELYREPR